MKLTEFLKLFRASDNDEYLEDLVLEMYQIRCKLYAGVL